jgi:hypothetical protein
MIAREAGVTADAAHVHHEPRRARTLEEIIRAKRPQPLSSVDELMAPDVFPSEEEVDEFVQALANW